MVRSQAERYVARAGQRCQRRRKCALGEASMTSVATDTASCAALLDQVVPALARRIGEERRVACKQLREKAHVVGVIGDYDEVERPREFHAHSVRRGHLLAARKAERIFRTEPCAEGAGIHGCAGMHVRVAPEDAGREVTAGVRRVTLAGRKRLAATLPAGGAASWPDTGIAAAESSAAEMACNHFELFIATSFLHSRDPDRHSAEGLRTDRRLKRYQFCARPNEFRNTFNLRLAGTV